MTSAFGVKPIWIYIKESNEGRKVVGLPSRKGKKQHFGVTLVKCFGHLLIWILRKRLVMYGSDLHVHGPEGVAIMVPGKPRHAIVAMHTAVRMVRPGRGCGQTRPMPPAWEHTNTLHALQWSVDVQMKNKRTTNNSKTHTHTHTHNIVPGQAWLFYRLRNNGDQTLYLLIHSQYLTDCATGSGVQFVNILIVDLNLYYTTVILGSTVVVMVCSMFHVVVCVIRAELHAVNVETETVASRSERVPWTQDTMQQLDLIRGLTLALLVIRIGWTKKSQHKYKIW
jgi:hypothetical protein